MMLVMTVVTATTEDLHLDDTDLDHPFRPIDLPADTEVTVTVNTATTNTVQTTVIGGATRTDLAGTIETGAETVATITIRETPTPADTKIAKIEVPGETAHYPGPPDLLVHLAIAKNAPSRKIAAVISPGANTIIGVTMAGAWGRPRLVPQQTSPTPRNWKKNAAASWQKCNRTLQKSNQSDSAELPRSQPRRKSSGRLTIGSVQTGAGSCLMSISEYKKILWMNAFGVAVVDLRRWRRIKISNPSRFLHETRHLPLLQSFYS
jgi:hypothetical protein